MTHEEEIRAAATENHFDDLMGAEDGFHNLESIFSAIRKLCTEDDSEISGLAKIGSEIAASERKHFSETADLIGGA
jgi:4-diphosphocytidyl-2C-methyl-D-erythritol kinase